jgi:mono/diheme cytochrome c family protein
MKRFLGISAKIVAGFIAILLLVAAAVFVTSELRIRKDWSITQSVLAISDSPEAIDDGRYLVLTRGCIDCHGEDLGGGAVIDDPAMGLAYAPNITPGKGTVIASYTVSDWARAIRHGVSPAGRSLILMPTEDYYFIDDRDLSHMIAYLQQLPAVDRESRQSKLGPLGRVLLVAGKLPILSAEKVDHTVFRAMAPPRAATPEYGEYVAKTCIGCHHETFAGGKIPTGPPDWPAAANLTPHPTEGIGGWTEEDFFRALREAKRPDGRELSEIMPRIFAHMTDEELRALWLYFQTLPPRGRG